MKIKSKFVKVFIATDRHASPLISFVFGNGRKGKRTQSKHTPEELQALQHRFEATQYMGTYFAGWKVGPKMRGRCRWIQNAAVGAAVGDAEGLGEGAAEGDAVGDAGCRFLRYLAHRWRRGHSWCKCSTLTLATFSLSTFGWCKDCI